MNIRGSPFIFSRIQCRSHHITKQSCRKTISLCTLNTSHRSAFTSVKRKTRNQCPRQDQNNLHCGIDYCLHFAKSCNSCIAFLCSTSLQDLHFPSETIIPCKLQFVIFPPLHIIIFFFTKASGKLYNQCKRNCMSQRFVD